MTTDKADKAKIDLGLLEEDDEFEEFPAEGNKVASRFSISRIRLFRTTLVDAVKTSTNNNCRRLGFKYTNYCCFK